MRILPLILIAMTLAPLSALAAEGEGHSRVGVGGFYGLTFINPTDINNKSTGFTSYTPKLNSLTSGSIYGADLEFRIDRRWSIEGQYEWQNAQNSVSLTSPAVVSGAGYNVSFTNVNVGVNHFLVDNGRMRFGLGVYAMIPTYAHVTETIASGKNEYDTDKNPGVMGQFTLGIMLGRHLSLLFDAGYQSLYEGNAKTSAGSYLTTSTGSRAGVDLSGIRADAGLMIHF